MYHYKIASGQTWMENSVGDFISYSSVFIICILIFYDGFILIERVVLREGMFEGEVCMALTQAAKETIWLRQLMSELGFQTTIRKPTIVYEDNQSAIALAKNPVYHARTKHIDVQYHFIRNKVESKEIELRYLPTKEMIADALTKPLPRPAFVIFVDKMCLRPTAREDVTGAVEQ